MYEFHCDYIKEIYGNKAKLRYTDKDRFILHIKTLAFFEDIKNDG